MHREVARHERPESFVAEPQSGRPSVELQPKILGGGDVDAERYAVCDERVDGDRCRIDMVAGADNHEVASPVVPDGMPGQEVGRRHTIGVEEDQNRSRCVFGSQVSCPTGPIPFVLLSNDRHRQVGAPSNPGHCDPNVFIRSVIGDHDIPVSPVILVGQSGESPLEKLGPIEDGDHHGDHWQVSVALDIQERGVVVLGTGEWVHHQVAR